MGVENLNTLVIIVFIAFVLFGFLSVLIVQSQKPALKKGVKPCKYPVVLHHGFMAGDFRFTFFGVKKHLEALGCSVFQIEVSSVNSIEFRAGELKNHIDRILEETSAEKVNIIAHSMGGLDSRYLISNLGYGEMVASLTTLSTPHYGTPLADYVSKHTKSFLGRVVISQVLNLSGRAINKSTKKHSADSLKALASLTTHYLENSFNPSNPDNPNVFYQSYAAKLAPGRFRFNHRLFTYKLIYKVAGDNDGVVPTSSGHWGQYQRDVICNHVDIIGTPFTKLTGFNHIELFVEICDCLSAKGY